jgi:hypothetical protein
MDLQTRKITFVQEFLRLQNEEIIGTLETILRKKKLDLYELNQKPMSLEKFNAEIDQALEDSNNGRLTKATDLKEKIKKWH